MLLRMLYFVLLSSPSLLLPLLLLALTATPACRAANKGAIKGNFEGIILQKSRQRKSLWKICEAIC